MTSQNVMTVASLQHFLKEFQETCLEQYQVWLSCDEEGNEYLPMSANPELSVSLDLENKRMILYPSHLRE